MSDNLRLDQIEKVEQKAATFFDRVCRITGEAANRFEQLITGEKRWGSGSAAPDTNLYRGGADNLKTDDLFTTVLGYQGPVEAASTGEAAVLVNYGLSLIASSSAKSLTLANPSAAGIFKEIYCTNGSSTNAIISLYTASTSVAFDAMGSSGATPFRKIVFDQTNLQSEGVSLRSYARATDGTLMWAVVGNIGTTGPAAT